MCAENAVDGRRPRREHGVAAADDRRPVDLRADDQRPVQRAEAHGSPEEHLRAERVAGQCVVQASVFGADARRVREDTEIARRLDATVEAHRAVSRVVVTLAGRNVDARSDRQRERIAVGAREAKVGPEAQVADGGRLGRRVRHAPDDALVAVLKHGDRQVESYPEPVPEHEARADVPDDLVSNDALLELAVRVDDERPIRAVHHDTDRGAKAAPQIQRLDGEPVAPALRRLEGVHRKALRLCAHVPG